MRIIRLSEVIKRTGRSRTSIYRDMALGHFPNKVKIGRCSVGWLESDIDTWITRKVEESSK